METGCVRIHLDVIINPPSKVLNAKSQPFIWREHKAFVVLVVLCQLVQQGFICGLRETEDTQREINL